MPITRWMRSPASDSRSARMSGTPPATDASNRRSTPAAAAASHSSAPWLASSSLLALTTGLPLRRASSTRSRAGDMPPITSTTTSIAGSRTTPKGSVVIRRSTPGTSRSLDAERTATLTSSSATPVRSAIRPASVSNRRASALPTLPQPSRPTRTVGRPQVPGPASSEAEADGDMPVPSIWFVSMNEQASHGGGPLARKGGSEAAHASSARRSE